jgi:hypothetical protein
LITRFLFLYLILIPRTVFASTTTAPGNTVAKSHDTVPVRHH